VAAIALAAGAAWWAGCATARVNHFQSFSHAGSAYSRAVGALLDQAGAAAIDADTLLLVRDRDVLPDRGKTLLERNQELRRRLAILADLKRHAQLLQSYFDALAALAGSNAPSGIGSAAEGLVKSLGQLSSRIADAKVGNYAVSGFVGSAAKIVVAHFRAAALEEELKRNAGAVARELELQEAALTAVAKALQTDLRVQLQMQETQDVALPFAGAGALPPNWQQRRKDHLQASLALTSAEAAAAAARKLKLSFVALAEGRIEVVNVPAIVSDINDLLTLMEKVKKP
jgi:hypothetical protein